MLKGRLPRVIYHQVYEYTKKIFQMKLEIFYMDAPRQGEFSSLLLYYSRPRVE